MNGGKEQSKEVAFRAFSLLEDYSALTEPWSSDRQQSILVSNRAQAYAMVSDPGVKNCAHCAGVKLYCQYRGFGCSKVDFFGGGSSNAYYQRLLDVAAVHDNQIAYLVAGMWYQAQRVPERAAYWFQKAKGIALADVLLGDLHVGCVRWAEAFAAYNRASRLTKRSGSGPVIALQSIAYCYKMGYGCLIDKAQGVQREEEARRRGYWKISQDYYEGLVQRSTGIAPGDRSLVSGDRSHSALIGVQRPVSEPTGRIDWPSQLSRGAKALTYIVSGAHKGKSGLILRYGFSLPPGSDETAKKEMVYNIRLTDGLSVVVWTDHTTLQKPNPDAAPSSSVTTRSGLGGPSAALPLKSGSRANQVGAGKPSQQQAPTQRVGVASRGNPQGN
jgi:hypothetical protein